MNSYNEIFKITSHDVDTNNNMTPSDVAKIMQETANHQMRDRKPTYYELMDEGKSFIVTRMLIEFIEPVNMYDEVRAHTWRCKEKAATFIRCFALEKDGKIMARGYSQWAVANRNTGGLCKASEIDMSHYETDEPYEMNTPIRFRLDKSLDFKHVGTKKVLYSDVDLNFHMNNTFYQNMIWNYIPDIDKKRVTSTNIRFMAEAKLGADIEIYMVKADEVLDDGYESDETFYFYTKVNGRTNIEARINTKNL